MTTNSETRTLEVTIKGETRLVEFEVSKITYLSRRGDKVITHSGRSIEKVGLFAKYGGGGKQWQRALFVEIYADETFIIGRSTTILNRAGYPLVGWATSASEHLKSRHLSA